MTDQPINREQVESLETLRVQSAGSHSLGAQQAYINGLEFHLAALRAENERLKEKCDKKSDTIANDTNRFIVVTHRIKELCPAATSLENGIEQLAAQLAAVTQERDEANLAYAKRVAQEQNGSASDVPATIKIKLLLSQVTLLGQQLAAVTAERNAAITRALESKLNEDRLYRQLAAMTKELNDLKATAVFTNYRTGD